MTQVLKKIIDKISQKNNTNKHINSPPGYDTTIIKTKNKSNFKFKFTSLEDGLVKTYQWYKSNFMH